jgi:thioredoxin reductase (NADPH)
MNYFRGEGKLMPDDIYDIAIVGCGPAGLSAAVCAKLRNKNVLLLGSSYCTRKLDQAPVIDNYLGINNISGSELRKRFLDHAASEGIEIVNARVNSIYPGEQIFMLISNEQSFNAKTVILATGVSRTATLPGEDDFVGKGVSYCATCDGPLYKGKTVAVISGIPEGEHEASYLSEICGKVYYLPQYKNVGPLPSNVDIMVGKRLIGIKGDDKARQLILGDAEINIDGIFLIYDASPTEQIFQGLEIIDGHVKVDRLMQTNISGIYAAGDCSGKPYQIAKAVGEGQIAALSAVTYLAK